MLSTSIYVGRRKCAVALVEIQRGAGDLVINGKPGFAYLQQDPVSIRMITEPLKVLNKKENYNIVCSVRGGGIVAQAGAIQLGIARALCSLDPYYETLSTQDKSSEPQVNQTRFLLKEKGLLRRDSRIKERRKYGLKKARKAEQYSKR